MYRGPYWGCADARANRGREVPRELNSEAVRQARNRRAKDVEEDENQADRGHWGSLYVVGDETAQKEKKRTNKGVHDSDDDREDDDR